MQLIRLIVDLRSSKSLEIFHLEVYHQGIYYLIPTYFDVSDNCMKRKRFLFENKASLHQDLNFRSFTDSDFYKIGKQLAKL